MKRNQRKAFRISQRSAAMFLLLWPAGCRQATPPEQATEAGLAPAGDVTGNGVSVDSHQRMIDRLRQIAEQAAVANPYIGRAALDELQREHDSRFNLLAPEAQVSLLTALGFHKLRVGMTDQAVADLRRADQLWGQGHEIPDQLSEMLLTMMAVAYFRVGETGNCVLCETGESCIFPFTDDAAIHNERSGSQQAHEVLLRLLQRNPDDRASRWLLNLAVMTLGEHPEGVPEQWRIDPRRFDSPQPMARFGNRAVQLGLDVISLSGGVIVDDFDGDDLLDIVFSDCHPEGQLRYFKNNGDGTFSDRTEEAGLVGITGGLNLIQADYNNSGALDILVLRGAWLGQAGRQPNSLLQNDGHGRFRDVTFDVGLGELQLPGQTAAWADINLNGHLDLYVGHEDYPCQLLLNDGQGRFQDFAQQMGVTNDRFTKGVVWGDFDGDGYPDLYVSNLGAPNRLYRNLAGKGFRDIAAEAGVEHPISSFPVFCWDLNNDGHLDLSVFSYNADIADVAADYLGEVPSSQPDAHYLGDGTGRFVNRTAQLNLDRVTHPMGANFGDIDHDGFLDFYLGTGDIPYQMLVPNLMFRNRRGEAFEDVTESSGLGHLQKGHGIAFADLDQDGDQDIVLQLGGAFGGDRFRNAVFENQMAPDINHWIGVKLVGVGANRSAIGAKIRVVVDDDDAERSIYRWVSSGGSFGANPLRQQIGVGQADRIKRLEIHWPDRGSVQQLEDLKVNQFIEVRQGDTDFQVLPWKHTPLGGKSY